MVSVSVFGLPEAGEVKGLAGRDAVIFVVVEGYETVTVIAGEGGAVCVVEEVGLSLDEVYSPPAARTVFCCCSPGCSRASLSASARYNACDTGELVCVAAWDHRR